MFDAGRRRATSDAAIAGVEAAAADYRESALAASQQEEDNLTAFPILEHVHAEHGAYVRRIGDHTGRYASRRKRKMR